MKKLVLSIGLVFLLVFVSGCSNKKEGAIDTESKKGNMTDELKSDSEEKQKETEVKEEAGLEVTGPAIEDYFPLKENAVYAYEGKGNEYATYSVYTDYIENNRIQQRIDNGGTQTVRVLEIKDGQVATLLSQGEYYRENMLNKTDTSIDVLLKEPLEEGTEWTLSDGSRRYISQLDAKITTPSGDYNAIAVITEYEDSLVEDYYAKGIGLVKSSFTSGDYEVTSTLKDINEEGTFSQTVKIYYPNIDDEKIYVEDKEITYKTNDRTKDKIVEAIKTVGKEKNGVVIGENVKLNSLYLNEDNAVYADFTKELITEMNAGAGYESMILTSLTNTLGGYYGVDKVYITVDGKPYESGHIALLEGESFYVNLEKVVE